MFSSKGFTLIELMVVVVIVAIFAMIAIPSYQTYIRKSDTAAAKSEMLRLADQLNHYKSRNFSYHGFDPYYLYKGIKTVGISSYDFPVNTNGVKRYTITLADVSSSTPTTLLASSTGLGQKWAISAIPKDTGYDAMLLKSDGFGCTNVYYQSSDLIDIQNYTDCGVNAINW